MNKKDGTYYLKDLSRKEYIILATKIIKEEGAEAISIRRIARELGCSSASLYRHFENLDELLYYAHLDSLNEYIFELSIQEKNWKDVWDAHFGIWQVYAEKAFKKPEAFEYVFYKHIKNHLGKALQEYYQMFPDTIILVGPLVKEMLEIAAYYDRDRFMCGRLAAEGKIASEDAHKLNHMVCTLFLGYFKYVQGGTVGESEINELLEQFMEEIRVIAKIYALNPKEI